MENASDPVHRPALPSGSAAAGHQVHRPFDGDADDATFPIDPAEPAQLPFLKLPLRRARARDVEGLLQYPGDPLPQLKPGLLERPGWTDPSFSVSQPPIRRADQESADEERRDQSRADQKRSDAFRFLAHARSIG